MSRTSGVPDGATPAPDPGRMVARWAVECQTAMEGVARRLTGELGVAEDMAQEATIKALIFARADPQRVLNVLRPCGWMCGIVRHVTLRWLDKETRRERLLGENAFLLREPLYSKEDPDWNVEPLMSKVLDMAAEVLTPRQLDVVRLMLADRSDAEVAEALDMAEATVRPRFGGSGPR